MDFTQQANTPYLHQPTNLQKKLVILIGVVLGLIVLLLAANFIFSDDAYKDRFDETIQQQLVTSSIADIVLRHSNDPSISHLASTAKSVSVSNANQLQDIKVNLFGEKFEGAVPDLTRYNNELEAAKSSGNADEKARELLKLALEASLDDLGKLQQTSSSEGVKESISDMQLSVSEVFNSVP